MTIMETPLFHLAFPVHDLSAARAFYSEILGCALGRSSDEWIDFNFYGHQIVAHLSTEEDASHTNHVDGEQVPVRHFGLILPKSDWETLSQKLDQAEVEFVIKPTIRFAGKAGEQGTFFVKDPSGNALEFKYFQDAAQVFATD